MPDGWLLIDAPVPDHASGHAGSGRSPAGDAAPLEIPALVVARGSEARSATAGDDRRARRRVRRRSGSRGRGPARCGSWRRSGNVPCRGSRHHLGSRPGPDRVLADLVVGHLVLVPAFPRWAWTPEPSLLVSAVLHLGRCWRSSSISGRPGATAALPLRRRLPPDVGAAPRRHVPALVGLPLEGALGASGRSHRDRRGPLVTSWSFSSAGACRAPTLEDARPWTRCSSASPRPWHSCRVSAGRGPRSSPARRGPVAGGGGSLLVPPRGAHHAGAAAADPDLREASVDASLRGLLVSAISGYAAVAVLLAMLRRVGLVPFAVACWPGWRRSSSSERGGISKKPACPGGSSGGRPCAAERGRPRQALTKSAMSRSWLHKTPAGQSGPTGSSTSSSPHQPGEREPVGRRRRGPGGSGPSLQRSPRFQLDESRLLHPLEAGVPGEPYFSGLVIDWRNTAPTPVSSPGSTSSTRRSHLHHDGQCSTSARHSQTTGGGAPMTARVTRWYGAATPHWL